MWEGATLEDSSALDRKGRCIDDLSCSFFCRIDPGINLSRFISHNFYQLRETYRKLVENFKRSPLTRCKSDLAGFGLAGSGYSPQDSLSFDLGSRLWFRLSCPIPLLMESTLYVRSTYAASNLPMHNSFCSFIHPPCLIVSSTSSEIHFRETQFLFLTSNATSRGPYHKQPFGSFPGVERPTMKPQQDYQLGQFVSAGDQISHPATNS